MKDERFDPDELERVRTEAARYGKDEAEEQRLMELGRRVEKLLKIDGPSIPLDRAIAERNPAFHPSPGDAALAWFRSRLLEKSHG